MHGDQLTWAARVEPVLTAQPKAQVYVNTANPGLASAAWPTSGSNGTAPCTAAAPAACAYEYGVDRAAGGRRAGSPGPPTTSGGSTSRPGTAGERHRREEAQQSGARGDGRPSLEGGVGDRPVLDRHQWGRIVGTAPRALTARCSAPSWLAGAPVGGDRPLRRPRAADRRRHRRAGPVRRGRIRPQRRLHLA